MTDSIAVISDIHSNIYALDAVLEDIAARKLHRIVNLGDSLFGPVEPVQTAQRLMNLENAVHIMGNCDRILLEPEADSLTFRHVKPLLTEEIERWIGTFSATWTLEDMLFCHGTPFSDEHYLIEEVTEHGVKDKDAERLSRELQPVAASWICCGHTHVSRTVRLPDGKTIVNPGSVGLPAYEEEAPYPHVMEAGSPHARYAAIRRTNGSWVVEHVQVAYDWHWAAAAARQNGRDDYAAAIRTGRMLG
ncbi:metallophosphoesterase family protein [Paenibacillus tyrfis]|uniref:metallophosphoesterase family protein n=1 Tax=Paenibacillus tyrfis TaxID=1501230 RepID=UPI000B58C4D0|nr:metallophosphoesterase family protein [Paenibacillus tyrfis]